MKQLFQKTKDLITGSTIIQQTKMDEKTYEALKAKVEFLDEKSNEVQAHLKAIAAAKEQARSLLSKSECMCEDFAASNPAEYASALKQLIAEDVELKARRILEIADKQKLLKIKKV